MWQHAVAWALARLQMVNSVTSYFGAVGLGGVEEIDGLMPVMCNCRFGGVVGR